MFWGLWAAAAASAVQKKHILEGISSFHLGGKISFLPLSQTSFLLIFILPIYIHLFPAQGSAIGDSMKFLSSPEDKEQEHGGTSNLDLGNLRCFKVLGIYQSL